MFTSTVYHYITYRPKGDRKGPHSSPPFPRLYYDYEAASQAVLSRGGGGCGDGRGPLRSPSYNNLTPVEVITIYSAKNRSDDILVSKLFFCLCGRRYKNGQTNVAPGFSICAMSLCLPLFSGRLQLPDTLFACNSSIHRPDTDEQRIRSIHSRCYLQACGDVYRKLSMARQQFPGTVASGDHRTGCVCSYRHLQPGQPELSSSSGICRNCLWRRGGRNYIYA